MKSARKLFLSVVLFFGIFISFSLSVSAASGWVLEGDAHKEDGIHILTEVETSQVGGYLKKAPIDTREKMELSFSCYEGEVRNQAREGMVFVMASKPIELGYYAYMGYDAYYFDQGMTYYGVEFRSGCINIVQNNGKSTKQIAYVDLKVCDSQWHDVKIVYSENTLCVYWDGENILSASGIKPAKKSYIGFTAGTSYWGCQKHALKNVAADAVDTEKIILNANGGKCDVKSKYVLDKLGGQLPTPKRTSYIFQGWYTKKTGGTKVTSKEYDFKDGQTLYAHWKDNRKKVTFNANGGTVKTKAKMVNNKAKIGKLPTPTRKGYIFQGWYTKKSGGTKITSNRIIKEKSTFYAHWISKNKKIKITLKKNGGKCSKTSITVKYGGKITGLPKATRKGYTFQGWYTKKNGGKKVTSSTKTINLLPTKTLYAHWKKKSTNSSSSSSNNSSSGNNNSWTSNSNNNNGNRCISCSGSGRKNCTSCSGKGGKYVSDSVPNYSGSTSGSNWYTRWERCWKCSGTGIQNCTMCGGDGRR